MAVERMAASEAILPQVLAALGLIPVSGAERKAAAAGLNADQRLIAEAVQKAEDRVAGQTVPSGPGWVERNRRIPGNSFIFPDQKAQIRAGEGVWQYPLFRQDLVDAGLLPQKAPSGNPVNIDLPPGMTVTAAIQAGVIR